MKIISSVVLCVTCMAVLCVGCQSTPAEPAVSIDDAVAGLVPPLVQEALASPCFAGGRCPVMAVGRIQNDTMMIRGGSLEMIKSRIIEIFSDSGKVALMVAPDKLLNKPSETPSLVLYGRLVQKEASQKGGQKQLEFTLLLSIVDVASGVKVWDGERKVGFRCDADILTW